MVMFTERVELSINRVLFLVVAIIGALNALYLASVSYFSLSYCAFGSNCQSVVTSDYGSILGIPISIFAVSYYIVVLYIISSPHRLQCSTSLLWLTRITLLMSMSSLVYLGIMFFVIGTLCLFCLLHHILVFLLLSYFVISLRQQHLLSQLMQITISRPPSILVLMALFPFFYYMSVDYLLQRKITQQTGVAAYIGSESFMLSDIDNEIKAYKAQLEQDLYRNRLKIIKDKLIKKMADAEKLTVQAFLDRKVFVDIQVTQTEVDEYYIINKDSIPSNMTRREVDPKIRGFLEREKKRHVYNKYVDTLLNSKDIRIVLQSPKPLSIPKNPFGSPSIGSKLAPIKIIEFADFGCSHCRDAHVSLKKLMKDELKDKIQLTYRYYPLNMKSISKDAAVAAYCSSKQGKFWGYIDSLYENHRRLSPPLFNQLAKKHYLDLAKFKVCTSSMTAHKAVDMDRNIGDSLGVKSTPLIVVNGKVFQGVPTLHELEDLL